MKAFTTTPIGLVGLGLVGTSLYQHLISNGYHVIGYDLVREKRDALDSAGGVVAESVAAVGRECATVILSVLDTHQVVGAVELPGGLLDESSIVKTVIDTTTGDPDMTVALGKRLAARGIDFMDATISGSSQQIRDREATFLVGGSRETYEKLRWLFDTLSDRHFYLGGSGAGSKAKLVSNVILGLNRLVLAEGLVFAETLGLELGPLLEVLKKTPAYSVAMDVKGEKMVKGNFEPQSRIAQHRKDLDIILQYALAARQPLPLTQAHHDILKAAESHGLADADTSAVLLELREMRGARAVDRGPAGDT